MSRSERICEFYMKEIVSREEPSDSLMASRGCSGTGGSRDLGNLLPRSRAPLILPEGIRLEDISQVDTVSPGSCGPNKQCCMSDGDRVDLDGYTDGEDSRKRVRITGKLQAGIKRQITLLLCAKNRSKIKN